MRVLLVKTSSLGDVVHALYAVHDASRCLPGIQFDWLVEENFAEVPRWHPSVRQVIPVALRRWRKTALSAQTRREWQQFRAQLSENRYDLILDSQGLLKSALLACLAQGPRAGFDAGSAREPLAALFYSQRLPVIRDRHAIWRQRQLFAQSLHYVLSDGLSPSAGIARARLVPITDAALTATPYVVFLHGTTWATKHWPLQRWQQLAQRLAEANIRMVLPWGNAEEQARAQLIAAKAPAHAQVLPRLSLGQIASVLADARAVVAVDTGLLHLAAALQVPSFALYGPTATGRTGPQGEHQQAMAAALDCAPCLQEHCARMPASSNNDWPPCMAQHDAVTLAERLIARVQRGEG